MRTLHLFDIRSQLALVSQPRCIQKVSNHLDEDYIHRNEVEHDAGEHQNAILRDRPALHTLKHPVLQDFISGHNGQYTFAWNKAVYLHPSTVKTSPVLEISALIIAEEAAIEQTHEAHQSEVPCQCVARGN